MNITGLVKYELLSVIMQSVLMITLFYEALILQGDAITLRA